MYNSLLLQQMLDFFGAAYMGLKCFQCQFECNLGVVLEMAA